MKVRIWFITFEMTYLTTSLLNNRNPRPNYGPLVEGYLYVKNLGGTSRKIEKFRERGEGRNEVQKHKTWLKVN